MFKKRTITHNKKHKNTIKNHWHCVLFVLNVSVSGQTNILTWYIHISLVYQIDDLFLIFFTLFFRIFNSFDFILPFCFLSSFLLFLNFYWSIKFVFKIWKNLVSSQFWKLFLCCINYCFCKCNPIIIYIEFSLCLCVVLFVKFVFMQL